jgi:hypothetical protein
MSTITLPTHSLVGLLSDVSLTAGSDPEIPLLRTVLLHTDRGEVMTTTGRAEEEPLIDVVPSDLLIGTSTDGVSMISQAHTACEGLFHRPLLISVPDVKAIVDVFKGKEVATQTQLETTGDHLMVSEDPRLAPGGVVVTVPVLDLLEDYPTHLPGLMQPDPHVVVEDGHGAVIDPSYGTGMDTTVFDVIAKVGKRRKMLPAWYRHHQRKGVVVEIGSMWRALFMPSKLDEDSGQHLGPQVRVFSPDLPVQRPSTPPLTVV